MTDTLTLVDTMTRKRTRNRYMVEYRLPHYAPNLWVVMTRVQTKEEMKLILKRPTYDGIILRGRTPEPNRKWRFFYIKNGRLVQSVPTASASKKPDEDFFEDAE